MFGKKKILEFVFFLTFLFHLLKGGWLQRIYAHVIGIFMKDWIFFFFSTACLEPRCVEDCERKYAGYVSLIMQWLSICELHTGVAVFTREIIITFVLICKDPCVSSGTPPG